MNDVRDADIVLRRIAMMFFGACGGVVGAMLIVLIVHFVEL
jgi:hypothetical protein